MSLIHPAFTIGVGLPCIRPREVRHNGSGSVWSAVIARRMSTGVTFNFNVTQDNK